MIAAEWLVMGCSGCVDSGVLHGETLIAEKNGIMALVSDMCHARTGFAAHISFCDEARHTIKYTLLTWAFQRHLLLFYGFVIVIVPWAIKRFTQNQGGIQASGIPLRHVDSNQSKDCYSNPGCGLRPTGKNAFVG